VLFKKNELVVSAFLKKNEFVSACCVTRPKDRCEKLLEIHPVGRYNKVHIYKIAAK